MILIDTHAHIYLPEFKDDLANVITRAEESGTKTVYMPNIDHTSTDAMLEIEHHYPHLCKAMAGLHPCSVKKHFERELYKVEAMLSERTFAAIGETGLDFYWDTTFAEQQKESLKIQINWAKQYKLPIVLHTRNSFRETMDIIHEEKDDHLTGVFHCFTGTTEEAKEVTEAGFFLGIGGVVTFKNGGLDKVLSEIDFNYVVAETDSPYLAPVPHRGKRNEPSYLSIIIQKIAELKKISMEEAAQITTENAIRLFSNNIK